MIPLNIESFLAQVDELDLPELGYPLRLQRQEHDEAVFVQPDSQHQRVQDVAASP